MTKDEMIKAILHKRNGYYVSFAPTSTDWITVCDELVTKGLLQEAPHSPGSGYVRYFINRKAKSH